MENMNFNELEKINGGAKLGPSDFFYDLGRTTGKIVRAASKNAQRVADLSTGIAVYPFR
ncbi:MULTISPECIES: hypothetical protein [unclassified Clostridium]|uniref:hypothetical protein n=1 Tax=unclassified Clostridium TaxID=2614128 RepID=UPI0013D406F2